MLGTLRNNLTLIDNPYVHSLIIAIIGIVIAKLVHNRLRTYTKKHISDPTAVLFIINGCYYLILLLTLLIILSQLGVATSSLLTVLGASSIAIGLGLKNSLANIASGILLLFNKPFKVGDFIEALGASGTVDEINIFSTRIKTADNEYIFLPNNKITNEKVENKTFKDKRRININIGVSYDADIDFVKQTLTDIMAGDTRILTNPAAKTFISDLADSAVIYSIRPWVKRGDFADVKFDLLENIKKTFDKNGIAIPYPQRDIHMIAAKP